MREAARGADADLPERGGVPLAYGLVLGCNQIEGVNGYSSVSANLEGIVAFSNARSWSAGVWGRVLGIRRLGYFLQVVKESLAVRLGVRGGASGGWEQAVHHYSYQCPHFDQFQGHA